MTCPRLTASASMHAIVEACDHPDSENLVFNDINYSIHSINTIYPTGINIVWQYSFASSMTIYYARAIYYTLNARLKGLNYKLISKKDNHIHSLSIPRNIGVVLLLQC